MHSKFCVSYTGLTKTEELNAVLNNGK